MGEESPTGASPITGGYSAINVGAMSNTHDRDFLRRDHKDHTVISDADAEVTSPLSSECFHVTIAGISVPI
jgi:hypothetical protein